MASLSDKETITRKTMIRKKQRSTGEHSSVWGRSKDELGQTGHARRMMRLKLTQKSLLLGICPTKSPIIPHERKGSGFSNRLHSVTFGYMQKCEGKENPVANRVCVFCRENKSMRM